MLSPCQETALQLLQNSSENIFLTGSAGSGKSFLIGKFLKNLPRKQFPVLASTGAAAVLIGGRTFHSFFGLGIMKGGASATIERALQDRRLANRLRKIKGFVLDEVSMIGAGALQTAETICRGVLESEEPWGGIRLIAVGDFAQLPPVDRVNGQRDWAFLGTTWQQSQIKTVLLKTILRSQDEEFLDILNKIRHGQMDSKVKNYLDAKTLIDQDERDVTYLLGRRAQVAKYNRYRLEEIAKPLTEIPSICSGKITAIEQLKKSAPIPQTLFLKEGALVMTRINDPQFRFINGSVGHVVEIRPETIVVHFARKGDIEIEKTTFSLLDAEGEPLATMTNFPLNLAYALTIHKAQGTTLDEMVADLRGLWDAGQAYVALSRLRSAAGLALAGWDERSIQVDPQVIEFHRSLESA